MNCPHCRSDHVVKAGVRKLKTGPARQLYRCNECCRRFSTIQRHGKRTPGSAILRALVLVCRGKQGGGNVSGQGFLGFHNIPHDKTRSYPADWADDPGAVVFSLGKK